MDTNASKELTIRDFAVIYRRRRKIIYRAIAISALLGAIYCMFTTRRYEATGTLEVRSKSQDKLGLENMVDGSSENDDADALSANINIETQANILQSETLALKTIEDLHMEGTQDFRPHWSPIGWVMGLFSARAVADPPKCQSRGLAPEEASRALGVSQNLIGEGDQRNSVDRRHLSQSRSEARRGGLSTS